MVESRTQGFGAPPQRGSAGGTPSNIRGAPTVAASGPLLATPLIMDPMDPRESVELVILQEELSEAPPAVLNTNGSHHTGKQFQSEQQEGDSN